MLMLSNAYTNKPNSSAVLIGAGGPVSQQFSMTDRNTVYLDCQIYRLRTNKDELLFKEETAYLLINISAIILYAEKC